MPTEEPPEAHLFDEAAEPASGYGQESRANAPPQLSPPQQSAASTETKWEALRASLVTEGGERVHRMLSGAAAEALRRAAGDGRTAAASSRGEHLAECAWDIAWEKLHIGDWKARGEQSA